MPEPNQEKDNISIWRLTQVFSNSKPRGQKLQQLPCGVGEASGERAGPRGIGPNKTYQEKCLRFESLPPNCILKRKKKVMLYLELGWEQKRLQKEPKQTSSYHRVRRELDQNDY